MAREMGERATPLIVFPGRNAQRSTERSGPFKSGLYHLSSCKPDAELIPVLLENLNRILPKGEALPVPMLSRADFWSAAATGRNRSERLVSLAKSSRSIESTMSVAS